MSTIASKSFANIGVCDMGRFPVSRADVGTTVAVFQRSGSLLSLSELLKIAVTGAANRSASFVTIHGGMLSCPVAFLHFTFWSVEAASIVNFAGSGSSMLKTRCVAYRHNEVIHRINKLGHIALRVIVSESLHVGSVTGWSAHQIVHMFRLVIWRRFLQCRDLLLVESLTQFRRYVKHAWLYSSKLYQ